MELKGSFPEVFSAGLGKCTKIKAKFELKENTRPIFRKKRNVPFAATEEINKELDRLVNMGILSKVEFSEWAAPTVYIRKKSREIRVFYKIERCIQGLPLSIPQPRRGF